MDFVVRMCAELVVPQGWILDYSRTSARAWRLETSRCLQLDSTQLLISTVLYLLEARVRLGLAKGSLGVA